MGRRTHAWFSGPECRTARQPTGGLLNPNRGQRPRLGSGGPGLMENEPRCSGVPIDTGHLPARRWSRRRAVWRRVGQAPFQTTALIVRVDSAPDRTLPDEYRSHQIRISGSDSQKRPRRPYRIPPATLPIAQRLVADADHRRELTTCLVEQPPDLSNVNGFELAAIPGPGAMPRQALPQDACHHKRISHRVWPDGSSQRLIEDRSSPLPAPEHNPNVRKRRAIGRACHHPFVRSNSRMNWTSAVMPSSGNAL